MNAPSILRQRRRNRLNVADGGNDCGLSPHRGRQCGFGKRAGTLVPTDKRTGRFQSFGRICAATFFSAATTLSGAVTPYQVSFTAAPDFLNSRLMILPPKLIT